MTKIIYPDNFYAQAQVDADFRFVIPPDTISPKDCLNCGGWGFMYYKSGNDMQGSPCPVCAGDQLEKYLANLSGLQGADLDLRLEHFKALAGKEEARTMAGMIMAMTPAPIGVYTFWGDYGVGKTTLLKAMVNGFRLAKVPAVYRRMADILDEIKETYNEQSRESGEAIAKSYKNYQALFIDEVDRIYTTQWALEKMFTLLDERYSRQSITLTVMATNADPLEFPENLQYLASRMTEGSIIKVAGVDVRPAVGLKKQKEMFRAEALDRGEGE